MTSAPSGPSATPESTAAKAPKRSWLKRLALGMGLVTGGLLFAGFALVGIALAVAYPNLPEVSDLTDYRPKLPMRVLAEDGSVLGEFGEERRNLTPIAEIPAVMKHAVLAAEDARFYEHAGVDYVGVLRAAVSNLTGGVRSGASTITMQVALNFYLSKDQKVSYKLYQILLAQKIERHLTKDQILELYMNQIFLGQRAYGFAAASQIYFGKPLKDITAAEAAMLAGLPKSPSRFNPVVNPKRATARQQYILDRMFENGFLTQAQLETARKEELKVLARPEGRSHAEFVAEMARQLVFAQYGEEAYVRGMDVHTTLVASEQLTAYRALRKGIMDYERRQVYRGPEKFIDLPNDPAKADDAIDDALIAHPDNDDVLSAVVLSADPKRIVAVRANGDTIEITGEGLKPATSGLSEKASPNIRVRRGAVIRIVKTPKGSWEITQLPEVEGAFVAMDSRTGGIRALVGGFDYDKNKFNHVSQAWRQPGSSFKPFIYSAALEKGFTPSTIVNDAPLFFDSGATGSQPWEPKNYDGTFDGPMTLRRALAKSKNMVSIRVLQSIGAQYGQEWVTRFGFDADKHPPYLTMALGAGSVTPLQMAGAYSVFANGGYRVNPFLIKKITDPKGKVLVEFKTPELSEAQRAIDARNAFVMTSLLQEITRSGTAAKAQAQLKRPDVYGKTGTTNDSMDAWFGGFVGNGVAAVVWIGYDNPRKLGDRETGGGLSLPVWITFMEASLKGVPVREATPPEGVLNTGGEWYFDEYVKSSGVSSVGLDKDEKPPPGSAGPPPRSVEDERERRRILDIFRN